MKLLIIALGIRKYERVWKLVQLRHVSAKEEVGLSLLLIADYLNI